MQKLVALVLSVAMPALATADVLWDNNIEPDSVNGRAMSPPAFPDIRVVDDFVVPAGEVWRLQGIRVNVVEDDGWVPGGVIEVYIRAHDSGTGGPVNGVGNELYNSGPIPFGRTPTGEQYFGRDNYVYAIPFPLGRQPVLTAGQYWIGFRNPAAGGSGTNWWLTSDGLPDGAGTAGWLSTDGGANFSPEGEPDWDHAFMLLGESILLWDNNLEPDGVNGRALSPPTFPDIRVVDDFVVPPDKTWIIDGFHTDVTEDANWADSGLVEVFIRAHDPNTGGPVNGIGNELYNSGAIPYQRTPTGDQYFGRDNYVYTVNLLCQPRLGPGRYWIGLRNPLATGSGTNFWMTSDGLPDGEDTPGWYSLDGGATFGPESGGDPLWDHAFVLTGREQCDLPGDINGDGTVDLTDLAIVLANYGRTCGSQVLTGTLPPPSAEVVPIPRSAEERSSTPDEELDRASRAN